MFSITEHGTWKRKDLSLRASNGLMLPRRKWFWLNLNGTRGKLKCRELELCAFWYFFLIQKGVFSIIFLTTAKMDMYYTHYSSKHKAVIQAPYNHVNTTRGRKKSLTWATSRRLRRQWGRWNFEMVSTDPSSKLAL